MTLHSVWGHISKKPIVKGSSKPAMVINSTSLGITTSLPSSPFVFPDQNRCEQTWTALHWSGFFKSVEAARAHWVLSGLWFSSVKHVIFSRVPMISVMAAN